jgi:RimJ/RimL family protein N-acetyltransferase
MDDALSDEAKSEAAKPIGPRVDGSPARRPGRTTLPGRVATLAPLDPRSHGDALYAGIGGEAGDRVWQYLFEGPFVDRADFDVHLQRIAASEDPLFFVILDAASGSALGYASYLRIEPVHRVIEVGNILYTQRLQQTTLATEAMYLMARHVFEDLGYRRYEWKCNALNAPSRRAALRFGFTFEGIFRQHMIVKGRNRDTAWFSMLDSEWPVRKTNFERWLDPSNFNKDGRQKVALSQLNAGSGR